MRRKPASAMCRHFLAVAEAVDTRTGWVLLSKVCNSFLSRAMAALSLTTFLLTNVVLPAQRLHFAFGFWQIKTVFFGAMLFLIGYLVVTIWTPQEFRGTSDVPEIVDRMLNLSDFGFFKSRLDMTTSLMQRIQGGSRSNWFPAPMLYVGNQIKLAKDKSENDWKKSARSLYHADLSLRQYDRPVARVIALFLLIPGISLLLFPTVISVGKVLLGLWP
jgi:hypothetical protein